MVQSVAVDYILAGHEQLYPDGKKGNGDHLDAELRMSQRELPFASGLLEARILYLPCLTRMKLDVRRAVRRLVWTKRDKKPLSLLPTRTEAYRVTPATAKKIDSAAKGIEVALSNLKYRMTLRYELGTPEENERGIVSKAPRFVRTLSAAAHPAEIQLRYNTAWGDPDLNSAWDELWEALGRSFGSANRIRTVVKYPVPLRTFVQTLRPEKL